MIRMIHFLMLMRLIVHAVEWIVPRIRRGVGGILLFIGTVVMVFWENVPGRARDMADHWIDRADEGGFDGNLLPTLWWIYFVFALGSMAVGFIVMSYATVGFIHLVLWFIGFIFRIIFGMLF